MNLFCFFFGFFLNTKVLKVFQKLSEVKLVHFDRPLVDD